MGTRLWVWSFWFEGEDIGSALYEVVDRLETYYIGAGKVCFGGFYDAVDVTKDGELIAWGWRVRLMVKACTG